MTLAVERIEHRLADTHEMRRNFHQFILLDVLQGLFEREFDGGRKDDFLIAAGSTDVGKFLCLADIDVKVAFAGMLSDDLSAVDFLSGLHEEASAVEEFVHRIGNGVAGLERYQRAVVTPFDFSLVRLILLETVGDDCLSLGSREHIASETHHSAGRDIELKESTIAAGFHMGKGALAPCRKLDRRAYELLGNLDREFLDRLAPLAADGLVKHLGLTYLKFESFAAHSLDKH